jgi:hypothetical protein
MCFVSGFQFGCLTVFFTRIYRETLSQRSPLQPVQALMPPAAAKGSRTADQRHQRFSA